VGYGQSPGSGPSGAKPPRSSGGLRCEDYTIKDNYYTRIASFGEICFGITFKLDMFWKNIENNGRKQIRNEYQFLYNNYLLSYNPRISSLQYIYIC
jgi:hypothetical protein